VADTKLYDSTTLIMSRHCQSSVGEGQLLHSSSTTAVLLPPSSLCILSVPEYKTVELQARPLSSNEPSLCFGRRNSEKCAYPLLSYTEKHTLCHVQHLIFTHFLFKIIHNQYFQNNSLQLTKFHSTLRAFLHADLKYEIIVTE
jgi:hypothetical protein